MERARLRSARPLSRVTWAMRKRVARATDSGPFASAKRATDSACSRPPTWLQFPIENSSEGRTSMDFDPRDFDSRDDQRHRNPPSGRGRSSDSDSPRDTRTRDHSRDQGPSLSRGPGSNPHVSSHRRREREPEPDSRKRDLDPRDRDREPSDTFTRHLWLPSGAEREIVCAASTTLAGRIASPELLLGEGSLPHKVCYCSANRGGGCRRSVRRRGEELVRAIAGRYREAVSQDKERILDEFVALTGYHRKHAIRVLNRAPAIRSVTKRGRSRLYDEAVRQALICPVGGLRSHLRQAPASRCSPCCSPRWSDTGTSSSTRRSASSCSGQRRDHRSDAGPARAATEDGAGRAEDDHPVCGAAFPCARSPTGTSLRPGSSRPTSSRIAARRHGRQLRAHAWCSPTSRAGGRSASRSWSRESSLIVEALDAPAARAAVPASWHRHRQRQRVHQRDAARVLPAARDRVHAVAAVSEERPGVGRAEERRGGAPARRLWPARRGRRGGGARATLLGVAALCELLPAVVQARGEAHGSAPASASATIHPRRPRARLLASPAIT